MGTEETANAGGCTVEEWGDMWRSVIAALDRLPPDVGGGFSREHVDQQFSRFFACQRQYERVNSNPPRDAAIAELHLALLKFLEHRTAFYQYLAAIGELGAKSERQGLSFAEKMKYAGAEREALKARDESIEWSTKFSEAIKKIAKNDKQMAERLKLQGL